MLPLAFSVLALATAHGESFVDFSLRSPDSRAASPRVDQLKAANLEELHEAEDLEKIHEAEHLEKIHEAEKLSQLKAQEAVMQIHAEEDQAKLQSAENLEKMHEAEEQEELHDAADLEMLKARVKAAQDDLARQPKPAPTAAPSEVMQLWQEFDDMLAADFEYLTAGPAPTPAIMDEDFEFEEAVKAKTKSEVQRLNDVERTLRRARQESDDAVANVEHAEAENKAFRNESLYGRANLPEAEYKTKEEVQRLDGVEDALRQARDAVSLAINGSAAAKHEAMSVAKEVKETEQQWARKARNSREYDIFRAGVSFLLGSVASRVLPFCFPWMSQKKAQEMAQLADPGTCAAEQDLENLAATAV